jgi:IS6 family transposase
VVLLAVRWYLRYGLSYRDVEELLAERGIEVDHVTVYRWVQRFTPLVIDAARPSQHHGHCCVDRSKGAANWQVLDDGSDQGGELIEGCHNA